MTLRDFREDVKGKVSLAKESPVYAGVIVTGHWLFAVGCFSLAMMACGFHCLAAFAATASARLSRKEDTQTRYKLMQKFLALSNYDLATASIGIVKPNFSTKAEEPLRETIEDTPAVSRGVTKYPVSGTGESLNQEELDVLLSRIPSEDDGTEYLIP